MKTSELEGFPEQIQSNCIKKNLPDYHLNLSFEIHRIAGEQDPNVFNFCSYKSLHGVHRKGLFTCFLHIFSVPLTK